MKRLVSTILVLMLATGLLGVAAEDLQLAMDDGWDLVEQSLPLDEIDLALPDDLPAAEEDTAAQANAGGVAIDKAHFPEKGFRAPSSSI